jgi:endonuclease I
MKKFTLIFFLIIGIVYSYAQPPEGYYSSAEGKAGKTLMEALHNIIKDHTELTYTPGVRDALIFTDSRSDGKVWDMYSSCVFTFVEDWDPGSGGNTECEFYNREHSFPREWFGGQVAPMNTDLFHIYPTDKKVNAVRASFPFGEVATPSYTSTNGSKLGSSSISGYSGTVFEPIDEYKGDFARTYFYMATRYFDIMKNWSCSMTNNTQFPAFEEWVVTMLLEWHTNDEVSDKERNRNNVIYEDFQGNRNPFIDNPEYAFKIWANDPSSTNLNKLNAKLELYPNPASDILNVTLSYSGSYKITIYNLIGTAVFTKDYSGNTKSEIGTTDFPNGLYLLQVKGENLSITKRFVIAR